MTFLVLLCRISAEGRKWTVAPSLRKEVRQMWKSVKYIVAVTALIAALMITCSALTINAINAK